MGYELKAKRKDCAAISIGAFSWPIMLQQTGAGFVIGYGEGRRPGSYVYLSNNNGSPVSNDGYIVKSAEAKAMAKVIRGYISVARFVNKEWEGVENAEVVKETAFEGKRIYQTYPVEERLLQMELIADFMEKSGGFTIR